eukprot:Rhum_TRINITY_DN14666_c3_g1::Rhum_TRINITY_DN14666_c3_g1_i1::g.107195::m.107195
MTQLPPVLWAERKDCVLVTVQVQDATDVKVKLLKDTVELTCSCGDARYATNLALRGDVVPEESTYVVRPRQIEMKLHKSEEGPYWEGLTKKKMLNVKVDWPRWVDEDEAGNADAGDFGLGGGGFPGGLEGMPGGVNLGGGGDPEAIQKMLADMGGLPKGDVEEVFDADAAKDLGADDEDDSDDDMPGLEKKA